MALRVRKSTIRKWPVTFTLMVGDDLGDVSPVEQSFVAHWNPISEAEHEALLKETATQFGDPMPDDDSQAAKEKRAKLSQSQILERNAWYYAQRICGWGPEVAGEDGLPLPFSQDALKALVTGEDGNTISAALLVADRQVRYGIAPAKNASTSPAPGAAAAGNAGEAKTS
jgi:hypothetical protein